MSEIKSKSECVRGGVGGVVGGDMWGVDGSDVFSSLIAWLVFVVLLVSVL